jgi:hypothetical protein
MGLTDMRLVLCEYCGSEGRLYTSRYGGNDPDVWPIGDCPVCEGTCFVIIETEPVELSDLETLMSESPSP